MRALFSLSPSLSLFLSLSLSLFHSISLFFATLYLELKPHNKKCIHRKYRISKFIEILRPINHSNALVLHKKGCPQKIFLCTLLFIDYISRLAKFFPQLRTCFSTPQLILCPFRRQSKYLAQCLLLNSPIL